MKKIENSFAVTGRIRRDAEIHLFEIVKGCTLLYCSQSHRQDK